MMNDEIGFCTTLIPKLVKHVKTEGVWSLLFCEHSMLKLILGFKYILKHSSTFLCCKELMGHMFCAICSILCTKPEVDIISSKKIVGYN